MDEPRMDVDETTEEAGLIQQRRCNIQESETLLNQEFIQNDLRILYTKLDTSMILDMMIFFLNPLC